MRPDAGLAEEVDNFALKAIALPFARVCHGATSACGYELMSRMSRPKYVSCGLVPPELASDALGCRCACANMPQWAPAGLATWRGAWFRRRHRISYQEPRFVSCVEIIKSCILQSQCLSS